jgi:uncharacterized protein
MTLSKRILILTSTVLLIYSVSGVATAADLGQAKAAGYVGEQLDGYLGLVNPAAPGDVKAMMANINAQRRAHYERIAKENSVSVDQVARLTAQKVIGQAANGHFVQTPQGWKKR